jgi:hypothetical protein
MHARIGRWDCRYRVFGTHGEPAAAAHRLERSVRAGVADAYGRFVDSALANDPAVYVIRRIRAPAALRLDAATSDPQLVQHWAGGLCAHVMNAVRTRDGGTANVIAFPDEPAYICAFVADLVRGRAWERWYYGAFAKYRTLPVRDAVLDLLLGNEPQLAGVVRGLSQAGSLDAVLTVLDARGAAAVWRALAGAARPADANEFRVIVRTAFAIAESLSVRCARAEEATLGAYVASSPSLPDWNDRRSLSRAVLSALRFAVHAGTGTSHATGVEVVFAAELRTALDWLDADWLASEVRAWLSAPGTAAEVFGHDAQDPRHLVRTAFTRVRTAGTPAQQRLLERLHGIVSSGRLALDRSDPSSQANALRLYAALAADSSGEADSTIRSLVVLVLAAWKVLVESADPVAVVGAMRAGGVNARSAATGGNALETLRSAAALGEPAAGVLAQLLAIPAGANDARATATRCAGVFLLVRAVADARLTQLVARCGSEPLDAILLALGIVWGGPDAVREGELDAGLRLWCGSAGERSVADVLDALDPAACDALADAVADLVRERRTIDAALALDASVPDEWPADFARAWPAGGTRLQSISRVALDLFRLWSRWLPGVASSSAPYLVRNVIRRAGTVELRDDALRVVLRPAPLDIVLEMAGFLSAVPPLPWLGGRGVSFSIDRS